MPFSFARAFHFQAARVIGLFLGLVICGVLVWLGLRSVVNHKYCPVLMEDWSRGFDEKIWTREVEVGGFGCVLYSVLFFVSVTS